MGSDRLGYRPQLDGLRAVAVVAVLAHHAAYLLMPEPPRWLASGGFLGVDLFFVLSGFLITRLIIERHAFDAETTPRNFYVRRAVRLLPALVFVLAANIAVTAVTAPNRVVIAALDGLSSLFYIANFVPNITMGHTWSLSIEEQFYIAAAPLLMAALNRGTSTSRIAVSIAVTIAAVVVWRWFLWEGEWTAVYTRTDARADALLVGVLMGVCWDRIRQWQLRHAGILALAVLAVLAATLTRDSPFLYLGGFTVVAVLSALVVAVAAMDQAPWAANRHLVAVGRRAYGLYLWHYPVFNFVGPRPGVSPPLAAAVALALTMVATEISWRLVEQPAIGALRRRQHVAQASPLPLRAGVSPTS